MVRKCATKANGLAHRQLHVVGGQGGVHELWPYVQAAAQA